MISLLINRKIIVFQDQFKYLYEAATNYHECFKTYGNMA